MEEEEGLAGSRLCLGGFGVAWVAWGFPLQRRKDKYRAGMYNRGSCNPSNSASACCRLSLVGVAGVGWDGGGFSFSALHVPTH